MMTRQSTTNAARMHTTTILHASILARASMALVKMTHSAAIHATAEKEQMNEREQFSDQKGRGILKSKEVVGGQEKVLEFVRNNVSA